VWHELATHTVHTGHANFKLPQVRVLNAWRYFGSIYLILTRYAEFFLHNGLDPDSKPAKESRGAVEVKIRV
jgi:hypothetical protein